MKIGLVLPSLPGYSETFFRNKILGLQRHGIEVILFVNGTVGKEKYLGCTVVNTSLMSGGIGKRVLFLILGFLKLFFINPKKNLHWFRLNQLDGLNFKSNLKTVFLNQAFLDYRLDWLHFGFGTMVLGRENIAQVIGAKMAVSFRGFDHYVYPNKHKDCYKILFSKSVKYHVLSDGMKQTLMQKGVNLQNIVKITPAIDPDFFKDSSNLSGKTTLQFLSVARLHWIKGLEYTLEALGILNQQGLDFSYTIIGDGVEKERLVFATHQLGISDKVVFLGKLSPEVVKSELEKADIYLQYSIQEGFCNAVLEAQALGKLCIVSDAEGQTENVIDKVTGFVVKKCDPIALANKIALVLSKDNQELEQLKKNAVERVRNEFNLEKQLSSFLSFYNE